MRSLIVLMVALLIAFSVSPADAGRFFRSKKSAQPAVAQVETQPAAPTIDEAAAKLSKGGLSVEETKRLSDIIDEPEREKGRQGHYSPGTCGMLGCLTHPEGWVWNDEESQAETDSKTIPWPSGGGFRRGRR